MKKLGIGLAMATVLVSGQLVANECKNATVSGEIHTQSISESTQVGVINLVVKDEKGKTYLDEDGAIVGQTTSGPGVYPISLNHSIFFGPNKNLFTFEDQAYPEFPPLGCVVNVTEFITSITATGKFKALSNDNHKIVVTGTLDVCTGANDFVVDEAASTVCLR